MVLLRLHRPMAGIMAGRMAGSMAGSEERHSRVKKEFDLELLADLEDRPESEIQQEILRTIRALDGIAGATRLYSVAGPKTVRTIQRSAMRSLQPMSQGEFVLIGEESPQ